MRRTVSQAIVAFLAAEYSERDGVSHRLIEACFGIMVGDGSYLMMASELVTAVQENIKITVILVQSHGFASIGALSQSVGSQRFGTAYRYRNPLIGAPDSQSWWDVPVAEVSELDSVNQARAVYDAARPRQRRYL